MNLKRDAQLPVAVALRTAIWNWIETFPGEFIELANGQRKLDGAPERVFDAFVRVKNEHNRKIMWPVLSALLLLCYERFKQVSLRFDGVGYSHKVANKELAFLDKMRKALTPGSKLRDTAIMCFSDMMRAAAYIPKEQETLIRSFATEIADTIKVSHF